MVEKLNTFMMSGVKGFWVVDPNKRIAIVYGFNNYQIEEYAMFKRQEALLSNHFSGFIIPLTRDIRATATQKENNNSGSIFIFMIS